MERRSERTILVRTALAMGTPTILYGEADQNPRCCESPPQGLSRSRRDRPGRSLGLGHEVRAHQQARLPIELIENVLGRMGRSAAVADFGLEPGQSRDEPLAAAVSVSH